MPAPSRLDVEAAAAPKPLSSRPSSRRWTLLAATVALTLVLTAIAATAAAHRRGVAAAAAAQTARTASSAAAATPQAADAVRFFVIGDWGRHGTPNQTAVAAAMGAAAAADGGAPVSAIISTGDNFYQRGLISEDDPYFDDTFTNVYTHPALASIPWHAVPGNHDWGELKSGDTSHAPPAKACAAAAAVASARGAAAASPCAYGLAPQLGDGLRARDPRWHAARDGSLSVPGPAARAAGGVAFFFFDSSPHVASYRAAPWAGHPAGLAAQFDAAPAAVDALAKELASSPAAWKFVVSHHPPASAVAGGRGDDLAAPLLAATAASVPPVTAILSGHDHVLAWLGRPAAGTPPIIISGGGSDVERAPKPNATASRGARGADWFLAGESGFADCTVTAARGRCAFVGVGGGRLFEFDLRKP